MSPPLKVGLLWHSASSGNLGVGALTLANMAVARAAATDLGLELEFQVIGMRDDDARYISSDQASVFAIDTASLLIPTGSWKSINSQDCVLDIGGGDSFAEVYGLKRFMFLWLTKMQAILGGTPLMLSPQTIGPFTRQPYIGMAKVALERATTVVARDAVSLQFLKTLAPQARAVQSVDVAFALPYQDLTSRRNEARPTIGVNVSGLLFNEALRGTNRFGLDYDYAEVVRGLLAHLTARSDLEVRLLTHVRSKAGGIDDDGPVADLLAQEFPGAVRVADFSGPSEAKSFISGLDFLIAGRMHACIAAFSAGTPVIPMAYTRKFSGLFGMLDYPWMVPFKGMAASEALTFLVAQIGRRSELRVAEAAGMAKVSAYLDAYRAELRSFFAIASARLK